MAEIQAQDSKQPLQKLSHMHEMIVLFMLENPITSQHDVAVHFRVTQGWLSQVVNCDMFQARLAEYRQKGFEVGILSVHEKLAGATSLALDKLTDRLAEEQDTVVLLDAANKLSQRLGHGASAPAFQLNVQDNSVTVASRESLAEARDIARRVKLALKPLMGESDEAPATGKVIDATPTEAAEVGPAAT